MHHTQPHPLPPSLSVRGVDLPLQWSSFKVIAFDMDSTLINIECIDELAKVAGVGDEVVRITEATMRGEIKDFKESLRARVSLLKGLALEQFAKKKDLLVINEVCVDRGFAFKEQAAAQCRVALLPLGTGNDLARVFGWGGGTRPEDAAAIAEYVGLVRGPMRLLCDGLGLG